MKNDDFFLKSKINSEIKTKIVSSYFSVWANIMLQNVRKYRNIDRIGYFDLFCGPGCYHDGTESTPIVVLKQVIQDPSLRERLVTVFNDKEPKNTEGLRKAIRQLEGVERLTYPPKILERDVDSDIAGEFLKGNHFPSLFFLDPWGYKGLSQELILKAIKDWGCECIFFFNYNRINPALSNKKVSEHMKALFTEEHFHRLKTLIHGKTPKEREKIEMNFLEEVFTNEGERYCLKFRFEQRNNRTSHYIVFITKKFLGYEKMKEIMQKNSTKYCSDVASFSFNKFDKFQSSDLPLFCSEHEKLGHELMNIFSGQKFTIEEIYKRHTIGQPYIKKDYLAAIKSLFDQGLVKKANDTKKRMSYHDEIIFPERNTTWA